MKVPQLLLPLGLVVASSFLIAQQQMHVVNSVPLSDVWKKMQWTHMATCSQGGDFVMPLVSLSPTEGPHELIHMAANGALLSYFDLHQISGFENAWLRDAAWDTEGRIVLLVVKVISAETTPSNAQGRSHGMRFRIDHTIWVLTIDDKGKVVGKFSFDQRVVMGQYLALFRSGNLLVSGSIQEGQHGELVRPGAVIFSHTGSIMANLKLPVTAKIASTEKLRPISGTADEVFLQELPPENYLLKVTADGTVGPKVKLAVPEDEQAVVTKIIEHRALAGIAPAQRIPGVVYKAPEWQPEAIFDTESGALIETLLVPQYESGPVCWSESGMTFIKAPEGTLDSLVEGSAASH
jgi:hypothetical protein